MQATRVHRSRKQQKGKTSDRKRRTVRLVSSGCGVETSANLGGNPDYVRVVGFTHGVHALPYRCWCYRIPSLSDVTRWVRGSLTLTSRYCDSYPLDCRLRRPSHRWPRPITPPRTNNKSAAPVPPGCKMHRICTGEATRVALASAPGAKVLGLASMVCRHQDNSDLRLPAGPRLMDQLSGTRMQVPQQLDPSLPTKACCIVA
eukprot:3844281-Pyramimonas_sp.AAC.1